MGIKDSDYLTWYNNEINRYRDHEWQLSSLSTAWSFAVLLFACNHDTKGIISVSVLALLVAVFILIMLVPMTHTHKMLNKYRTKRDLLLAGKPHAKICKTPFCYDFIDGLYFLGFVLIPVFFGMGIICILLR